MLAWTAAGAVSSPRTLQIRIEPRFEGRIVAGAPQPDRALDDMDLRANLRHFTEGRRGPRTLPVQTVVLSGVTGARAAGVAEGLEEARGWGVERVVLHVDAAEADALAASPLAEQVDVGVLRVRKPDDADVLASLPGERHAVVVLDAEGLDRLPALLGGLARVAPDRLTLSWPFPGSESPPPPAATVIAALRPVLGDLDGAWGVKGLPLCALLPLRGVVHELETHLWRSANRFYVDAEHQLERALVFFPDVVRFEKRDHCRFCAVDSRCDGVVAEWLAQGLAGPMIPLSG